VLSIQEKKIVMDIEIIKSVVNLIKSDDALSLALIVDKIKTVNDLTNAIKQGTIKSSQTPLDYVIMDGQVMIFNTRTSTVLINANIPKSEWFGIDRTSQLAYDSITYDQLIIDQLEKNYKGVVNNARK
jgi:filamentous hemagglutinin